MLVVDARSRATSSGLRRTGRRRGSRTDTTASARSRRFSVILKKNRSALAPADPASRRTPCPPKIRRWRLQVSLSVSRLSPSCLTSLSIPFHHLRPMRHYPHLWISARGLGLSGTSTHLTRQLSGTHYGLLLRPSAPGLSLTGVRLIIPDHAVGLPVLRDLSLCTS